MASPRTLQLGIIGLGPEWESVYLPALQRLEARGRIAALYAAVRRRGEETAGPLHAHCCGGVRALLRQPLQGVIVTHPGAAGWFPVHESLRARIDCYTVIPEHCDLPRLEQLHRWAASCGLLIMPELRLRYTPATLRLRELMATELGPVQSLEVRALAAQAVSTIRMELELLDWCRATLAAVPLSVESQIEPAKSRSREQTTRLRFVSHAAGGSPITVALHLPVRETGEARHEPAPSADAWPLEFIVRGKYGEARLEDAVHLRWRSGGRERVESLAVDRSAVAVAIDHFARRLAGGLIPVPDLEDLAAAARLAERAQLSRQTGKPVELRGSAE